MLEITMLQAWFDARIRPRLEQARRDERGVTMEYVILLSLLGVAVIAIAALIVTKLNGHAAKIPG